MEGPKTKTNRNVFGELFKNSQRRTYTTLGATIILVVALSVLAIRPTIIKVGEIQNEIKDKQALKKDLDDKLKILIDLDQKYRAYEEAIPKLDESIPEKTDTASLTANISEILKTNGMVLNSIQFVPLSSSSFGAQQGPSLVNLLSGVELTKITLTVSGTYAGLKSFVKVIEQYPRPMHINKISLSTMSGSSSSSSSKGPVDPEKIDGSIEIYTIQKSSALPNNKN